MYTAAFKKGADQRRQKRSARSGAEFVRSRLIAIADGREEAVNVLLFELSEPATHQTKHTPNDPSETGLWRQRRSRARSEAKPKAAQR